jgi:hypothetical protein
MTLQEEMAWARATNIVINGGMEVSQANGANLVANAFGRLIDCWKTTFSGTMAISGQQVTDAPAGFANSIKFAVTTAQASLGAGDYQTIYTPIEGYRVARLRYGTADVSFASLAFSVKANRPGGYGFSIINSAGNRSYPSPFTVNSSGVWEYKTAVIPGDTTGTWLATNGVGLSIFFTMAAGASVVGPANTWQAGFVPGVTGMTNGVADTADYMQIGGVSFIPGTVPVSQAIAPQLILPFDEMLLLCQRQYEKSFAYAQVPATNTGVGDAFTTPALVAGTATQRLPTIRFRVKKRAASIITLYNPAQNNANVRDLTANQNCSSPNITVQGDDGFYIETSGSSATAVNNRLAVAWVADAGL